MIVTVCSLFVAIHLTSSLNVDIPLPLYELARGGNAVLPCNFKPQKPDNPSVTISWVAHPDNPDDSDIEILTYYYISATSPVLDIMDDFTNRASLDVDIPKGSAVLTLKDLTSKDNRTFQCEVKIPGDRQGKTSDTTKVVVLVAPSKPICGIQGKAEYYQNINLTCRSEEGTPPPTYQWKSYDVTNTPRPFPLKATEANGVLSLYNISAETSGYYICTSANKLRTESCNLTLSVMPFSMNIGSTAGIIGGCVVGLLLLIIVVCCCCRRYRKKKEQMEYTEHGEYTDKEPEEVELHKDERLESKADKRDDPERVDRPSDYNDRRSDRYDDPRNEYDDHRSDRYNDRRNDRYDDRRSDYDDRRSDYDDRRSDYDDRRSDYSDRRNDRYNEPRDRYDDRRRDRYDDRQDRYDRYDDRRDRYDHPDDRYDDDRDDRSRPPTVPTNKPTRN